jgi:D-serine deaminase-like pyridoxal phosphate-dependent protein
MEPTQDPALALHRMETPCLLLDHARLERNVARLTAHLGALGVPLRPHVKTSKSREVIRATLGRDSGPVTVSTLKEAEYVLSLGLTDILYAVGITPNKLDHVTDLRRRGAGLILVVDNLPAAWRVAAHARQTGDAIPVLIEIDSDGHRAGLKPDDPAIIEIGRALASGGAEFAGLMTHAGGSYDLTGEQALVEAAETERRAVVDAAARLAAAGLPSRIVSEVRAGVFVFFDLVMAGIGVCRIDDIALTVLSSVITSSPETGRIIVDAGWMALSRDRGTARQSVDQFYGLVCDLDGTPYPDLVVLQANQEHGLVGLRPGSTAGLPDLPAGSLVRILPNHACATAAQHDRYVVVDGREVRATWPRINGW